MTINLHKKPLIITFLLAIIITLFLFIDKENNNNIFLIPRGMGTAEDPNARANFEWMKLRNPKTNKIPANIRYKELTYTKNIPTFKESAAFSLKKTNEAEWAWKGPANISGRTRAFRFDLNNENNIIAGGIAGGMWKSTDGGDTWTKKTRNDQLQSVSSVAQDPRQGFRNVWYYGTGEKTGGSAGAQGDSGPYSGNGIFKSTDNGETWELLASTASNTPESFDNPFDYVWNILVDNNGNVYAACVGQVYRSSDGGATWNAILGDGSTGEYSDIVITSNGNYYAAFSSDAGQNAGIWQSTDGVNFTDITPNAFPSVYNRIQMALAPSNENVLYLISELGDKEHIFWKYTDGTGWEDRSTNLVLTFENDKQFDSQGGYDLVIGVKPDDENFVVIGGVDVWRSTDGFASTSDNRRIGGTGFTTLDYPNHFPDHHVIRFLSSDPKVMYVGNDGGIYKTMDVTNNTPDADGVTVQWAFVSSKSYNTTLFFGIDIDKATSGSEMIAGGMQDRGNFRRASGSNDWPEVGGGDGMMSAVADGGEWFVSSTQSGSITRYEGSDYKTETWIKPADSEGQLWVTPYYLDPSDNNVMYYAAGEFLWRNDQVTTADDNTGWNKLNNSQHSGETITAIGVSKNSSSNVVYYGTDNGKVYRMENSNTGDPTPADLSAPGNGSYVSSLYVDPENSNKVILVYSNYEVISIYHTADGGSTWTNISGNLEENSDGSGNGPSVRWGTFVNVGGTYNYYAGTSTGLYSTTTLNGTSTQWVKEGAESIGNSVVIMMIPREVDDYLAVATHGSGVFSATLSSGSENNAPTISLNPTGPFTVAEGSLLSITLLGNDVDANETLTYSSSNLPANASLNNSTGVFTWTPGYEDAGAKSIQFTVMDKAGASASATADITITNTNRAPSFADVMPDQEVQVNNPPTEFSFQYTGSDPDNDNITFSLTAGPEGSSVTSAGLFKWVPSVSQVNQSFDVTVTISDGGLTADATTILTTSSTVTGIENFSAIPTSFALNQNYPNPFNPTTNIRFDLIENSNVEINVYSVTGEMVAQLVNRQFAAGYHYINFDATKLASGIYIYRIISTSGAKVNFVDSKKMLLVK